jgi:hypothetical protein
MSRRFPPPWTAIQTPGGWCIKDADGQALAYVYGRESAAVKAEHLTVEEARRIAVNIAKLPELVGRKEG